MRKILISGATGLIGSEYLRRVLSWEKDAEAWVLVRGLNEGIAQARGKALLTELFPDGSDLVSARSRARIVRGNIAQPKLGLTAEQFEDIARQVTDVCHLAADVRFDLPIDKARAINVEGTRNMLEMSTAALRHGNLRRHHQVSTYATGRAKPGENVIHEDAPPKTTTYANSYEQTKAESEMFVLERAGELPVSIYRPSIVQGDSRTGWSADFKVFYVILKLFAYGAFNSKYPIQFQKGALSDGVSLDYVTDCLYALTTLNKDPSGAIYNLVAAEDATTPSVWFKKATESLREAIIKHGGTPPDSLTVEEVDQLEPEMMRTWLKDESAYEQIVQFFPYITRKVIYSDQRTRKALQGVRGCTRPVKYSSLGVVMDYCIASDWGLNPKPRPALPPCPLSG